VSHRWKICGGGTQQAAERGIENNKQKKKKFHFISPQLREPGVYPMPLSDD